MPNSAFGGDSGYYIGFKTGASIQDYSDVKFVNPRITGTEKDNTSEDAVVGSLLVGKKTQSFSCKIRN